MKNSKENKNNSVTSNTQSQLIPQSWELGRQQYVPRSRNLGVTCDTENVGCFHNGSSHIQEQLGVKSFQICQQLAST